MRDSFLGRPITDIDITVSRGGIACARALAAGIGGAFVVLDEQEDVGRVVYKKRVTFDISAFRGPDLATDLSLRDFSINAMACCLSDLSSDTPVIVDPVGGLADLTGRSIRAASERAFRDDALRCLRAYRFAAELEFDIEAQTRSWIPGSAEMLAGVSPERIHEELEKLLATKRATRWLPELYQAKLLQTILPEFSEKWAQDGGSFPVSANLERNLDSSESLGPVHRERPTELSHIDDSLRWLLRLASSIADHDQTGDNYKRLVSEVSRTRLRLSNREARYLLTVLDTSRQVLNCATQATVTDEMLYEIERAASEDTEDALILARAVSELAPTCYPSITELVRRLLSLHKRHECVSAEPRILTGEDLMRHFDLGPGPILGELLSRIERDQVTGIITSREVALDRVATWLTELS